MKFGLRTVREEWMNYLLMFFSSHNHKLVAMRQTWYIHQLESAAPVPMEIGFLEVESNMWSNNSAGTGLRHCGGGKVWGDDTVFFHSCFTVHQNVYRFHTIHVYFHFLSLHMDDDCFLVTWYQIKIKDHFISSGVRWLQWFSSGILEKENIIAAYQIFVNKWSWFVMMRGRCGSNVNTWHMCRQNCVTKYLVSFEPWMLLDLEAR